MDDTGFPSGRDDYGPYVRVAQARDIIGGGALTYLTYTGPEPPTDPIAHQAPALAYRSEIILRYAAWAARHWQSPDRVAGQPARPFTPVPLRFTELRLWLPSFYYDEEEGLPSAEPIFSDVRARLEQWHDLVLLGPPGSGKTTTIWRLARDLAGDGLAGSADTPLPLIVEISGRQASRDGAALLRDALEQAAVTDLDGRQRPLAAHRLLAQLLPALLAGRRMVLLWDGLDEGPRGQRGSTTEAIEALRRTAITRILNVVTCRADSYPTLNAYNGLHVTIKQAAIQALDPPAIHMLIRQWLGPDRGQAFLAVLGRPTSTGAAELARNPLLLHMLCEVYAAYGEVPTSQGWLLAAVVAARFAGARQRRPAGWIPAEVQTRGLARLAGALTASHGRGSAAARDWAIEQLGAGAPAADPNRLLRLAEQSGLVTLINAGTAVRFSHALVQEYFAALALRDQLTGAAPGDAPITPYPERSWQRGWEETLLLLASLAGKHSPIWREVRAALSDSLLPAASLLIAGSGNPEPEPAALVRSVALEQISDAGLRPAQRLAAGQALGLIGDPRYPVSLPQWRAELGRRGERFGQPDGYWCYVQPGAYQIGAWKEGQAGATVALAGFWIGRFPITAAQFAPFVEEGYADEAQGWWTPQGWNWRRVRARTAPEHWDDPQYTAANQPAIGLSWYEATAYCAWLSARLGQNLPPGYVVRLPTEAEWEAAAAFDHERRRRPYPWGHAQPTPDLAIYNALGLSRPAPVGCCPGGVAACGALDMVGGVEEWCSSWSTAYPAASNRGAGDPPSGGNIQLGPITPQQLPTRGGWWAQDGAQLGCGQRFWHYASATSYSDGFRIVLAAPLTQPS